MKKFKTVDVHTGNLITEIINIEKRDMRKDVKGITLIALVVTIVVLLILAAVSISMLGGENGIITQAQKSKRANKVNGDIEIIKMALSYDNLVYETGEYPIDEDLFLNELKKTDPNADVNYTNYPNVIVYYNNDYYQIDIEKNKIEEYDANVARIDDKYYMSLQKAFDDVLNNNQETTVYLLKSVSENCEIKENQNIKLELEENVIDGTINNNGTIKIYDGKMNGNPEFVGIINYGSMELNNVEIDGLSITNNQDLRLEECKIKGGLHNSTIRNYGNGLLYNSEITGYGSIDNRGIFNIQNSNILISDVVNEVLYNEGTVEISRKYKNAIDR